MIKKTKSGFATVLVWLCFFSVLGFSGCGRILVHPAPGLLPGIRPAMLTPGYWISRHPFPDKTVLSPEDIQELNSQIINELKTVEDITEKSFKASATSDEIAGNIKRLSAKSLYLSSGIKADEKFYEKIAGSMGVSDQGGLPEYGLVVTYSDQRILPTQEPLYAEALNTDFDELQNNTLNSGTPVAVLSRTRDGKWVYTLSSDSAGWVEAEKIAFCSKNDIKIFAKPENFAVVTASKEDIYLDAEMTKSMGYVQMGTRLPLVEEQAGCYAVLVPSRNNDGRLDLKTGYIRKSKASRGYLSYIARNIIFQAFEMINAPYGWGGMFGEQDCSRYVQQIFATVGVMLPRNSADQAKAGRIIAEFDQASDEDLKRKSLAKSVAGISLLYMKGHIMLYLGESGGRPYAIHSTWAYRVPDKDRGTLFKIGRVAVTDLELGKGSKNGSLLERLKSVRMIQ